MRRLPIAVLLASMLCGTGATTTSSQSSEATPEPPPSPGVVADLELVATAEPQASRSAPSDPWWIEVPDSGFRMRFPAGWQVDLSDTDADIRSAVPGSAWEALRAAAADEAMACVVAVGVTDLAPGQWFASGIDGVSTPYWDLGDPTLLWVPTPTIEGVKSFHSTEWRRRTQEDAGPGHDVYYVLQCVADDDRLKDPGRTFARLMASFDLLP